MKKIGFDQKWISWIIGCMSSVNYSIIIDGEAQGFITPTRGLRQGDPISPYLFLLCAEALSGLLLKAERNGSLTGVKISRTGPTLSHLFFADDSLLFCKADLAHCDLLKSILSIYGTASGQVINFDKSSVGFSKNIPEDARRELATRLGIHRITIDDKYLGLPS